MPLFSLADIEHLGPCQKGKKANQFRPGQALEDRRETLRVVAGDGHQESSEG